ncbi:MAG: UDP binding domain-containing protein [bacterium]
MPFNLVYTCETYGLEKVARYWETVLEINDWQETRFIQNMLSNMFNTVAGKRIALFGFAFKANTGDTRESPAIYIAQGLLEEQAELVVTDPKAIENARKNLKNFEGAVTFESDPYKAAQGAHAIAVLTEWDIYRDLDYQRIFESMAQPAFLFDGRNILDHRKLFEIGFHVFAIGKAPLKHF